MDGLRGLAIVLVVVNHIGPTLFPEHLADSSGAYGIPLLRGLLGGGAVVVFFVIGGFIVTLGLLRELDRGVMDPARFLARRFVRLGVQLVLLGAALVAVQAWDSSAPGTMQGLFQHLGHVFTYTLNAMPHPVDGVPRVELGHLWYLSVQQQCYLLLPLFLIVATRWRILGMLLLVAGITLVYLERQATAETSWLDATMFTTTRSDGLMWGVLLALLVPWLSRYAGWSRVLALSLVGMLACQLVLQELEEGAFLGPWSLAYQFVIGTAMVAIWLLQSPSRAARMLAWRPLTWLGQNSLTLYFWHFPVLVFVARHGEGRSGWALLVVSLAVIFVLCVLLERAVEEPTRRLLARSSFFRARPRAAS